MQVDKEDMDNEILSELLLDAGARGGAVLEEIGKTDLASLTEDEWLYFLHEIVDGFHTAAWEKDSIHLSQIPF